MRILLARRTYLALLILLNLAVLTAAPIAAQNDGEAASADDRGLPLAVRGYLVEHYFAGTDPMDFSIDQSVEALELPEAILDHIRALEWERGQLEYFANNKLYLLVTCPDGTQRAIHFRDGSMRKDRELDVSRVNVLKRLYSAESFIAPPSEELQRWMEKQSVDANGVFVAALACAINRNELNLGGETVRRAYANLTAEKTNTDTIIRALGALAESDYAEECCWAAIWLLSRMDKMKFWREQREYSICDLEFISAQTFYENVFYAIKARNELPWGRDASDSDFLQQVLPPRGTGEPLQRWRRHFWDALTPEIEGLTRDEVTKAIELANNTYADYFQYEGDTTWEDFGMLTSLAVHEGRCEDMSNVLNSILRTLAIPACQAYTPWWGHCDGNHAWTWIRGIGEIPGDGQNGVKVYIKTWDGREDVTSEYTAVTTIELDTDSTAEEPAEMLVWNHDEWREVAKAPVEDGKVTFENVGCALSFALCIRVPDETERIADVRTDGSYRWLNIELEEPDDDRAFEVEYGKSCPLGEFQPDAEYALERYTLEGWKDSAAERTSTGGVSFTGHPDRLYRFVGDGFSNRPFTVELDPATGEVVTLKR